MGGNPPIPTDSAFADLVAFSTSAFTSESASRDWGRRGRQDYTTTPVFQDYYRFCYKEVALVSLIIGSVFVSCQGYSDMICKYLKYPMDFGRFLVSLWGLHYSFLAQQVIFSPWLLRMRLKFHVLPWISLPANSDAHVPTMSLYFNIRWYMEKAFTEHITKRNLAKNLYIEILALKQTSSKIYSCIVVLGELCIWKAYERLQHFICQHSRGICSIWRSD